MQRSNLIITAVLAALLSLHSVSPLYAAIKQPNTGRALPFHTHTTGHPVRLGILWLHLLLAYDAPADPAVVADTTVASIQTGSSDDGFILIKRKRAVLRGTALVSNLVNTLHISLRHWAPEQQGPSLIRVAFLDVVVFPDGHTPIASGLSPPRLFA